MILLPLGDWAHERQSNSSPDLLNERDWHLESKRHAIKTGSQYNLIIKKKATNQKWKYKLTTLIKHKRIHEKKHLSNESGSWLALHEGCECTPNFGGHHHGTTLTIQDSKLWWFHCSDPGYIRGRKFRNKLLYKLKHDPDQNGLFNWCRFSHAWNTESLLELGYEKIKHIFE